MKRKYSKVIGRVRNFFQNQIKGNHLQQAEKITIFSIQQNGKAFFFTHYSLDLRQF